MKRSKFSEQQIAFLLRKWRKAQASSKCAAKPTSTQPLDPGRGDVESIGIEKMGDGTQIYARRSSWGCSGS